MSDPIVTVFPTSFGTIEGAPVYPGDQLTITATAYDPDTHTEEYTTTATVADGVKLSQHTELSFTDDVTVAWKWASSGELFATDVNPLNVLAPDASDTIICVVTDQGGHETEASCPVTVTPIPVPPAPVTKWGICTYPYPVMPGQTAQTRQQRYDEYKAACGQPDYYRVYLNPSQSTVDAWPTTWPIPGEVADWAERGCVVSGKFDQVKLAAGLYDAKLTMMAYNYAGPWMDIVNHHECEDDIEGGAFTAAQWRTGTAHLRDLVRSWGRPEIQAWVILMGWTFDAASHRNPMDYWVNDMDGYSVDTYNDPSARHDSTPWRTPASLMDPFVNWMRAKDADLQLGWTETGCVPDFTDVNRAPAWILSVGEYARAKKLSRVSYFDETGPKADWGLFKVIRRNAYYPTKPLGTITSISPDNARPVAWKAAING